MSAIDAGPAQAGKRWLSLRYWLGAQRGIALALIIFIIMFAIYGAKQELYVLLRKLADEGAAILLYSTDYDELIGCCDKVLVMYDGAVQRTLAGADLTEHALIASALNLGEGGAGRAPVAA